MPNCSDYAAGSKIIGMMTMTLRGTPFIYEGQEIGMTNIDWNDINSYDDISSFNQYKMALDNGLSPNEAIKCVQHYSRDNARTPMQWSSDANAGFTTGKPWLPVNSNYEIINVENEQNDEDSTLSWYIRLKELRSSHNALVNGSYQEIMQDSEDIYAYIRENDKEKLLVLLNFTDSTVSYDASSMTVAKVLLSSASDSKIGELKPYEAICISLTK